MKLLPFIPYRRRRKDREIPKAAYCVALALLLLQTSALFGQAAYVRSVDMGTISTSGKTFTHINSIAEINVNVEYVIAGSPTITSIVLAGCMRGGTCDTLSTYTSSTNKIIGVTGLYDSYTVTATWTGGSSPSVTVNWLATSNSSPAGSVAADPCQSNASAKSSVPIAVSGVATTQVVALSGTTVIYVCGFWGYTGGTTPTLLWVAGTGSNCVTGTTNLTGAPITPSASNAGYFPGMTAFKTPAGAALCITQTGTSPTFGGVLTYVQQ